MADEKNDRLRSPELDANVSVLGDDGRQGAPGRLGEAPEANAEGGLTEAMARKDGTEDGGNQDLKSQHAAKEATRDVVDGYGKR